MSGYRISTDMYVLTDKSSKMAEVVLEQ